MTPFPLSNGCPCRLHARAILKCLPRCLFPCRTVCRRHLSSNASRSGGASKITACWRWVRMAPLYDAVTPRVFPRLKQDRMALKLNGKDDRLRRRDFQTFARTARLKAGDADTVIERMIEDLGKAADGVALPILPEYGPNGKKMAEDMLAIVRSRVSSFK